MTVENRTEKYIRKKRRRKKRYLLRFILFVLACAGIYFALHIDYFTVDGIIVAGNKEITDAEIVTLSEIKTGDNIFDVHPWFAQRRIKKNLYVENVNVNRKLPNKIEILVTERSGKAQFAMGGKFVITDNGGKVLEIAKEERKATLVDGVRVTEAKPGKDIEVKDTGIYEKAMALIALTEENDLYFKRVKIADDDMEGYVYDGLICKGKYNHAMECIESGALKAVVFDLYQKGVESGVINISSNNYCSFTP